MNHTKAKIALRHVPQVYLPKVTSSRLLFELGGEYEHPQEQRPFPVLEILSQFRNVDSTVEIYTQKHWGTVKTKFYIGEML